MKHQNEDSESDIELPTAVLAKKKKVKIAPTSPTTEMLNTKKASTKTMVQQALVDLKTRKGVSLHAIKKYIEEKYQVKPDKINFFIKKYIKTGVETGTIIQTKGVGVTGSFKLAAVKPEKNKKLSKPVEEKVPKEKAAKEDTKKKIPKEKTVKKKKETEKETKEKVQKPKKSKKIIENNENSPAKLVQMMKRKKIGKEDTKKSTKPSKMSKSPTKKKAVMIKRKSIGSIIKAPKMNPKAKP